MLNFTVFSTISYNSSEPTTRIDENGLNATLAHEAVSLLEDAIADLDDNMTTNEIRISIRDNIKKPRSR
ncbi:hypothetical protein CHS0354_006619 [Potamilus streckersoni]|uniref:Uncharacterized protein n=1 Tax=Potamilus streckersoni TaxID=2493646 RepID=A0AAE0W392_9BIVA|nr:hypothetical protein CHS0354_006619 [Potamilus streckersoni]